MARRTRSEPNSSTRPASATEPPMLRRHLGHELAEQERVAAGRRVTGRREVIDRVGDARADQGAGRLGREGGGTDDLPAGGGQRIQ